MTYNEPMDFTEENIIQSVNSILITPTDDLCYAPPNSNNIFAVYTVYSQNQQTSGSAPYQYQNNATFYRNRVNFQILPSGQIMATSGGNGGNITTLSCLNFEDAYKSYLTKNEYNNFWFPVVSLVAFIFILTMIYKIIIKRLMP